MEAIAFARGYYTTREAAKRLGVSVRTVQMWCENGVLESWKTEGGHRRITKGSVETLQRDGRSSLPRPLNRGSNPAVRTMLGGRSANWGTEDRIRLLIVEDDNVLLRLYRLRISQWGLPIDLYTAGNGYEGLILVGRECPDMMVLDLMLPGIDGFDLVRRLSGSALKEGMEVAAVTQLEPSEIERRGGLPSSVKLFHKPVPFDELRGLVLAILARRASL
jgi:excisionase family DNA binding protein